MKSCVESLFNYSNFFAIQSSFSQRGPDMKKHLTTLGLFGLLVAGIGTIGSRAAAAEDRKDNVHAAHFEQCAKACADCMRECEKCAHHCAVKVSLGEKAHMATMALCADCAEVCAASARIMSRGGPLAGEMCEACAKACDRCAAGCEKHPDDEHMKRCAKECRDCAKSCREMVKHLGH